MGLFGKKKEKEEEISFGFPASEKSKEEELPGILPPPPMPGEETAVRKAEPMMLKEEIEKPEEVMPRPLTPPAPQRPIMRRTSEQAMPEEIRAPREPVIREVRPHVFLKIDKYKEVMMSIDKMSAQIRDLTKSLENLKDIEERELMKIKDTESTLVELNNIAAVFDKIFSNPAK